MLAAEGIEKASKIRDLLAANMTSSMGLLSVIINSFRHQGYDSSPIACSGKVFQSFVKHVSDMIQTNLDIFETWFGLVSDMFPTFPDMCVTECFRHTSYVFQTCVGRFQSCFKHVSDMYPTHVSDIAPTCLKQISNMFHTCI